MPVIRVVEVLAALSLTTDLAAGVPFEKGLRTCLVADRLSRTLRLPEDERRVVQQVALLRSVGCTSHASENAALFVDDVAFQRILKVLDPGDPEVFAAQLGEFGGWAGFDAAPQLARRFVDLAGTVGPAAARTGCEVSQALGPRLGLEPRAVRALDEVYERFDGLGIPDGRRGDDLTLAARIVHVAEQAVLAHARGGAGAALAEVRRRAGGHLDPDLVELFLADADALSVLETPDLLAAVLAVEPDPVLRVPFDRVEALCEVLATVVDLKGRWLIGHSQAVAELAATAGRLAGLDDDRVRTLTCAALVHDIGRVTVSSEVWDRPGPLGLVDTERVRLHPYWTQKVLERCAALAPLATVASAHHERSDASGYHRGARGVDLPAEARILAAADVFAALVAERPHRPAHSTAAAARVLTDEAAAARLDPQAVACVIEAGGLPRPRPGLLAGLTEREVDVLRLAARGLSNREIAGRLGISERTVGHHLAHVYDKTGRRTRAGVAVFGAEHGLLQP